MSPTKISGKKLHAIAHASHTAEVTMTSLALRERNRHFSDIGRTKTALIRAGEKIVDEEYRRFWTDLAAAGVGNVVRGRRGVPDRFEWYYSLKQVANAALTGKDSEVERAPVADFEPEEEIKTKRKARSEESKEEKVEHSKVATNGHGGKMIYIPLRENFDLDIRVPSDISQEEIEVIQKALKKLSA